MKRYFWPLAALVLVMLLLSGHVDAITASSNSNPNGVSNGATGTGIATYMYCSAKFLLQGYIGLLIGLAMAAMGLWGWIRGHGAMAGLTLIVFGSIITAVPVIIESSLGGLSSMMDKAGIGTALYTKPECGEIPEPPIDDAMFKSSDGLIINMENGNKTKKPEPYVPPPPYAAYSL